MSAGPSPLNPCWEICLRITEDKGSPHGWRATFRSWCADNGIPREVAERALAHALGGVEAAYNRAAMVERGRPVMQAWADHCDGKDADNVAFERRGEWPRMTRGSAHIPRRRTKLPPLSAQDRAHAVEEMEIERRAPTRQSSVEESVPGVVDAIAS
jgi:hypothetical protein